MKDVQNKIEISSKADAHFLFARAVMMCCVVILVLVTLTTAASAYLPGMKKQSRAIDGSIEQRTQPDIVAVARNMAFQLDNPQNQHSLRRSISSLTTGKSAFRLNPSNSTPFYLGRESIDFLSRGASKTVSSGSYFDHSLALLSENSELFLLENPSSELQINSETVDGGGNTHLRLDQVYQGLPVWNNSISMHFNKSGEHYQINGRYSPTPSTIVDVADGIDHLRAIELALDFLSTDNPIQELSAVMKQLLAYDGPHAEKGVWTERESTVAKLAWRVTVWTNMQDSWIVYVDALSEDILESYNENAQSITSEATGTDALGIERTFNVNLDEGSYYLEDLDASIQTYDAHSKVIGGTNFPSLVESVENIWDDPIAVSAHYNARLVYDYYLTVHGRDGIDGEGGELPIIVHYTQDGTALDNAFWNGRFIAFGDYRPFAAALDIVAHELSHGVIEHTAGLEYRYQSGALNESFSDVMAAMLDPDWTIGEDLPGGELRDMANPERFGQPSHMDEYRNYPLSVDQGGVHINMSIPSKAAWLIAESIGREKTASIWYHCINARYLLPRSNFIDMRLAAIRSAKDLFGEDSPESVTVAESFDAVGIVDDKPSGAPEDSAAIEGEERIAFVLDSQTGGRLAIAKTILQEAGDIFLPGDTRVYSESSNPLTVCRDGSVLMFVDSDSNIRKLDLKSFDETIIDDSGIWSSIRLAPNGGRLAATTVFEDSTLHILDLDSPDNSFSYRLYTASTEGIKTYTALYADALDWSSDSSTVLYDALHRIPLANGSSVEFWDVNTLDVATGIITRIKTPTDNNTQVGNPSYAETNDRFITCDLFSSAMGFSAMVAIDLYSQEISMLKETGMISFIYPNIGHPKYSPDDRNIVYNIYNRFENSDIIYKLGLDDDHMTANGAESTFYYGMLPVWFAIPEEPIVLDVAETVVPETITLGQNRPNPFNPITTISFALPTQAKTTLNVFDMLGRKVATLVDDSLPAGKHSAVFDATGFGSGVYFYRLESENSVKTGKMLLIK